MDNCNPHQRAAIVLMYAQNKLLIIAKQSEFRRQFLGRNPPLPPTIRQSVAQRMSDEAHFELSGQ